MKILNTHIADSEHDYIREQAGMTERTMTEVVREMIREHKRNQRAGEWILRACLDALTEAEEILAQRKDGDPLAREAVLDLIRGAALRASQAINDKETGEALRRVMREVVT